MAYDINDSGQVVGYATNGGNAQRAFLFSNGIMQDLGNLGGRFGSLANGINELGQVVGTASTSNGHPHAFFYSNGTMQDLGTLGGNNSVAYGVNASGQVIGDSLYPGGGLNNHSFLYSNGIMSDLNNLLDSSGADWSLIHANGIDDSGSIVGWGLAPNGQTHAFLLTSVPEPMTALLVMLSMMQISKRRRFIIRGQEKAHTGQSAL